MTVRNEFFDGAIKGDFFSTFCDECLGSGQFREVWSLKANNKFVAKIETGGASFENISEWEVWQNAPDYAREWLAPCDYISENGVVLIQRRTTLATTDKFPEKIPSWLADTSFGNFGMLGKRFVAHDYGHHRLYSSGFNKRMVKAKWW